VSKFARSAVLFCVVALAATGCSLLPEERVEELPTLIEPPPSRAVTYPVERATIVEEIRGLARVAPTLETNMYFKESGRLALLNVEPGQRVTEGEILAQLETGTLTHELEVAKVDQQMAEIRLASVRTGGTPVEVRLQELNVEKSRLEVEHFTQRLEDATIRAPHDGIVQSVRVQVGQLVPEYQTALVVADPEASELQVEMRRTDEVNKLARGQRALVEVRRDNWQPAELVQITQRDERGVIVYVVHLELEDGLDGSGLRLGDLVSVRLLVQEKENALVIPRAALREFMGRRYVRVLDGDARREVDVEVGIVTPTEVEILRGISEGDLVIGQ